MAPFLAQSLENIDKKAEIYNQDLKVSGVLYAARARAEEMLSHALLLIGEASEGNPNILKERVDGLKNDLGILHYFRFHNYVFEALVYYLPEDFDLEGSVEPISPEMVENYSYANIMQNPKADVQEELDCFLEMGEIFEREFQPILKTENGYLLPIRIAIKTVDSINTERKPEAQAMIMKGAKALCNI
ncbi:MAG: hypothetical protein AB9915_03740 [Candidatus Dojkabacteria bacterium]